MALENLTTETPNPRTADLDLMSPLEFAKVMNDENLRVFEAVEKALPEIAKTIEIVAGQFKAGGRLFYAGAGTSGRLGLMDAVECVPTFGVSDGLVIGLIAGGERAFVKAVEGAEDSKALCVEDLKKLAFSAKDVFVGIAASGRTPYVIGGLEYAASLGAETVAVACNYGSEIGRIAKTRIEVDAGSEVLTGSTRLKAGTAQKIILNMISTGAMIQTGKVYKNLMVDVLTTNKKLVDRARRIVMRVTGVGYDKADAVLNETHNKVKPAIVMILNGCNLERAQEILKENDGFIRKTIKPSGPEQTAFA
ncbi:MAG: N-acetylmuramic acid 6-phosphate etherase [Spirochaetaceae bacterium]|jgi:N-acetylmuramic acid 6-phosphate etherase|nr:N-acetylmuramic acid 6-phosphate etherase [Spirochaetaceae bacterium]